MTEASRSLSRVVETQARRIALIGRRVSDSPVGRSAKHGVLVAGLLIAYLLILLPIAAWRWWLPGRRLSTWRDPRRGGWRQISQSTSSVEAYRSLL